MSLILVRLILARNVLALLALFVASQISIMAAEDTEAPGDLSKPPSRQIEHKLTKKLKSDFSKQYASLKKEENALALAKAFQAMVEGKAEEGSTGNTENDSDASDMRYVLLTEACRLATMGDDLVLAVQMAYTLCRQYDIDLDCLGSP